MIKKSDIPGEKNQPLNELTKQEFRDATRHLSPMTDDEFDKAWQDFQDIKARRGMH